MGAGGAQSHRSLGHHLLHPQIFRLLVLVLKPADFEAQIELVSKELYHLVAILQHYAGRLIFMKLKKDILFFKKKMEKLLLKFSENSSKRAK